MELPAGSGNEAQEQRNRFEQLETSETCQGGPCSILCMALCTLCVRTVSEGVAVSG